MLRSNCFELICQCMNKFQNNAELQTAALLLLCVIASYDGAKKSALVSRDVVSRAIQNCVDRAPEPLLAASMTMIDFMADRKECIKLLLVPHVLQVLLDAMETYDNVEIRLHGACIMATLANLEPSSHKLLIEVESYATMITMINACDKVKAIRNSCFSYFVAIFQDHDNSVELCNKGILPYFVSGIENRHNEKLLSYLNVLVAVFQHEMSMKIVANCGVLDKLLEVLQNNADNADVIATGLHLLYNVMLTSSIIPAAVQMGYLSALTWCAESYTDSKEVCLWVMQVMVRMATCPSVRAQMIASHCVETVFKMKTLFYDDKEFPGHVCQLLSNLSENPTIKERLAGGVQLFEFMVELLNDHVNDADVIKTVLGLIRQQAEATAKNHKKFATQEMLESLCQVILQGDHAISLMACDLVSDALNWNKALGGLLQQDMIHQLIQALTECVEDENSIATLLRFLQAIGTRCAPSIESFLLLLFAVMGSQHLSDANQQSILDVLRTVIYNDMYTKVMMMGPFLARFFTIVEGWKATPARLAELLSLNQSVLTNKSCTPTLINCNGIPLFVNLAKEHDDEKLLTPVFCILAASLAAKNAIPIFLNHKCLNRVNEVMEKYTDNQELQAACCEVLLNVANTRGGVMNVMQSKCYVPAIANLEHCSQEYLEICCNLLNLLAHDDVNNYKLIEAGVAEALLRVLSEQIPDEVAEPALSCVKCLIQNPDHMPKFTQESNLEILCASFPQIHGQAYQILCDVLITVLGSVKEFVSPLSASVASTIVMLTAEKAKNANTMRTLLPILYSASATAENRAVLLENRFVDMVFSMIYDFIANRDLVLLYLNAFTPYYEDELFARTVVECEGAKVLNSVMTRYTTIPAIQSAAIKVLLATTQFVPSGVLQLQATVVCIRCVQLCISDDQIVLDGCRTLLNMAADPVKETAVESRKSIVENGGLEPFYIALQRYPKNVGIVSVVLRALRYLADGSSDVNRIASAAYLKTLMLVYSNFSSNSDVTTLFVQLICSLSAIESCKPAIIQTGVIAKVIASTQAFPDAHELLFAVAGAISYLAMKGPTVCESFHKFGAESVLICALEAEDVPADTAILISSVFPSFFQIKTEPELFVQQGGIDALLSTAKHYPEDVTLHGYFMGCLSVLTSVLSLRPALAKDEVLDFALAGEILCQEEEEFVIYGATLFSVVVENDTWIRENHAAFFEALVIVLSTFPESRDVAVSISELCLSAMDYLWNHGVQYFMKDAAAEAAVLFIDTFMNDRQVVTDCCSLLNSCKTLADEIQFKILTRSFTVLATY